jgi:hypothetical protein
MDHGSFGRNRACGRILVRDGADRAHFFTGQAANAMLVIEFGLAAKIGVRHKRFLRER